MHVPFVDLKAQYQSIKPGIDNAVSRILEETAFIGGAAVSGFEDAFSRLYGVKHCISCGNGTDSLYIIMKMLGIGIGDEVIVPAHSWISSSETVSQTGAVPVFVDTHPDFFTINEELIEQAVTPRTKAIMPVHLYGQMCAMTQIMDIAKRRGLYVIEDCAQSHFSEFNGKRAGLFGDAASFSFYPGKNLGAYGDAGCIITNDDELAEKCRMFARHGALKKHEHKMEGINSRMDGLQAAVLMVKLPHILDWNKKRIFNAGRYNELLKKCPEITLPKQRKNSTHTWHLYVIKTKRRDELAKHLKNNGIETAVHYPMALPNLPAYVYLGNSPSDFPVATAHQSTILSLPMYPELSNEAAEWIAKSIYSFF